jgi:drug/metabolite transporter (DMT)-like permease
MWLALSLSTAILVSFADALSKKLLKTHESVAVALIRPGWSSLFLMATLPWALGPAEPWSYWKPVLFALPLEVVAALAFNRALQIAPLSLVIPYMAFTPVFLILGSRFFLGEHISAHGGLGIAFVAFGAIFWNNPPHWVTQNTTKR